MQYIKVGAAVVNQTPLNWRANQHHIEAAIQTAKTQGVNILCLPELCISGYGCEDRFLATDTLQQSWRVLQALRPQTQNIVVAVGLPLAYHNRIYNTAALLVDGRIAGFVAKRVLARDGIHYETRWFEAWQRGVRAELHREGIAYPIGDISFNVGGVRIGFEICEEAWIANRPGIALAETGVDVLLNPSASHFAFDKHAIRKRFVLEGSRAFSVSYVYANLLGNEAGRAIYDGDAMIASGGKLLANSKRFSYADHQLIHTLVDVDITRMAQARSGDTVPPLENSVTVAFDYPYHSPRFTPPIEPLWEHSPTLKEEEFSRAVSLGLFDYLRKSHSHGFVLSLSGGADSGAIACLVYLMVQFGIEELGLCGFCAKLAYMADLPQTDSNSVLRHLLTCVYQATDHSSHTTRQAAQSLAQAIHANYHELNVEHLYKGYIDLVTEALGRPLTWEQDDLALQNIQARSRAPSVWLLANVKNALLLATSNRSEAALGYATMDGDTSGGLSPLAGIDKTFLRQWLCWLEEQAPAGIDPLPVLSEINQQAPTAELRPATQQQTDEDDLMPYEVLNAIEKAAIRDRQTPTEILWLLRSRYLEHDTAQLAIWIERFFTLWTRNQWKRERYAPSFQLDDTNLDPKTGCRFPILSGSFTEELQAMREAVRSL